MRPKDGDTLAAWHGRLSEFHGMGGGFMSAQVVADMKYIHPLLLADDWGTFAASGPGSRRGLNLVLGRSVDAAWRESDWRATLRRVYEAIQPELPRIGVSEFHAQDLQNCLCEFSKYERTRLGHGRPKRRFVPTSEPLSDSPTRDGAA